MEVFLKIIGYLSIPLVLLSVFVMIRSLRRDQRLTSRSLITQMLVSLVFIIAYALLLRVSVSLALSTPLLVLGLILGVLWNRTTHLRLQKGEVFGRRSIWYLVIWGLSFSITQLMALTASAEIVSYGLSTVYFSTGLAIGTNGSLLFRRWRLISSGAPVEISCPACGTVNIRVRNFCTQCGQTLAPTVATAPVSLESSTRCPRCGHINVSGERFCTECGQQLS